jgi:hypothetical protein
VRPSLPALVAAIAWAAPAAAHVSPSERENNRHILLAPLGDRVRFVYTVYMGQEPGRKARARMDADRDGKLSDSEADQFGRQFAAEVAPRLRVEVDGRPTPIAWQEVDVGLGEPITAAGAFAVDMVAWLCLDEPRERTQHRVRLRDGFHLPDPGETELRAEESPGLRVTRSELGGPETLRPSSVRLDFRWMGGPGPIESEGYRLDFEVDPAMATFAGACGAADAPARGRGTWIAAGAAALALIGGAALWLSRRLRR